MYSRQFLVVIAIIGAFIYGAIFIGTWFRQGMQFAEEGSLDRAQHVRPLSCTFKERNENRTTRGTILIRDGLMRVDVSQLQSGEQSQWAAEIDITGGAIMSKTPSQQEFISLDGYPDAKNRVLSEVEAFLKSEYVSCSPWWSARSYHFSL